MAANGILKGVRKTHILTKFAKVDELFKIAAFFLRIHLLRAQRGAGSPRKAYPMFPVSNIKT